MFERYTEKSRRAIFFARYEASNYGSQYITTEHLLLGLLREDHALMKWFPGEGNVEPEIRAEIEKRIPRGERISTSVEIPLTRECKKVLNLAEETSQRFEHRLIEPVHMLIGILRVEKSMAAQILTTRGVTQKPIEEKIAQRTGEECSPVPRTSGAPALERFLAALKGGDFGELISFFATNAEFIDASGKKWNNEELSKGFETLFAPFAKRNASYAIESTLAETSALLVATVLWRNALLASEQRAWMHRMSVVLLPEGGEWKILLAQVTPTLPVNQ